MSTVLVRRETVGDNSKAKKKEKAESAGEEGKKAFQMMREVIAVA
jgi:hypothetical protein